MKLSRKFLKTPPRPYQLALENGSQNIILQVIKDLADLARGNSPLKRSLGDVAGI